MTSSSVSRSTDSGTAPGAVKSNLSLPGAFSEPACAADSPSAPRSARCTRWVAVCDRDSARRRSTSISANAGAFDHDLARGDLAAVHDEPGQRGLHVEDRYLAAVHPDGARVGELAAALGVERGAVQHHVHFGARARRLGHRHSVDQQAEDRRLAGDLVVAR